MNLQRIIEIGWLVIATISVFMLIYLSIAEGFSKGKAWVYIITALIAGFMWLIRRNQRLKK